MQLWVKDSTTSFTVYTEMIKGAVSEQTHLESITPDHISFSSNTALNIHKMHGCYATAELCNFSWRCVLALLTVPLYISDNKGVTHMNRRGKNENFKWSNTLGQSLHFYTKLGFAASLHFARGKESCIHLVYLIEHDLWKGVALQPCKVQCKYTSPLNPRLAAVVYFVILSSLSKELCDPSSFFPSRNDAWYSGCNFNLEWEEPAARY